MEFSAKARRRLEKAHNLWLATVQPNGAPHLVPIWFVWQGEKVYFYTPQQTVKVRNIRQESRVMFSLEDATNPLLIQGNARILDTVPPEVIQAFTDKFDWDIVSDSTHNTLIEITPTRIILGDSRNT